MVVSQSSINSFAKLPPVCNLSAKISTNALRLRAVWSKIVSYTIVFRALFKKVADCLICPEESAINTVNLSNISIKNYLPCSRYLLSKLYMAPMDANFTFSLASVKKDRIVLAIGLKYLLTCLHSSSV